jgi:hypothetical protein
MAERCIDLRQVAHVDQNDGARRDAIDPQELLDVVFGERAIGQARERIVIREMRDARFALRDAGLHGVERGGELAEIFRAAHRDGVIVLAFLDPARRLQKRGNRAGGAASRQQPHACGEQQRYSANGEHGIAHVAIRREHCVHWPLHEHVDRVGARGQTPGNIQILARAQL